MLELGGGDSAKFSKNFPLATLQFFALLALNYNYSLATVQFQFFRLASLAFNFNMNVLVSHFRTPTHMNLCTIYTSLFIITRIQNSNTVLGEESGPLDPPSNTTLLNPIIHINTEKSNIKTFQQLNTLHVYYMQVVCKTLCKTWKANSCPLYLTLALFPPPPLPLPIFFFFFFFLLFKKIVAVENKYSVLNLPGNKFSGRARDENK